MNHCLIAGNLCGEFSAALKRRHCYVMSCNMRVRVGQGPMFCYPDLVTVCGPLDLLDEQNDTLLNPTLITEVVSPSTEEFDRGLKSTRYRTVPSLRTYALVSQDEPHVEIYHRNATGEWVLTDVNGLDAACQFDGLAGDPISIPMSEIYDKVEF